MKQFKAVLSYEYGGYIKNKAFRATTIVFVVVILLASFIPQFLSLFSGLSSDSEKTEAAIIASDSAALGEEASAMLAPEALDKVTDSYKWTELPGGTSPEDIIKDGKYEVVLTYSGEDKYMLYGSAYDFGVMALQGVLDPYLTIVKRQALISTMTEDEANAVTAALSVDVTGDMKTVDIKGRESGGDAMTNYLLAYILIYVLFMVVMMYGQFVVNSVVVEKSTKMMELLVTSAGTTSLMYGKVLGVGLAALTQLLCIILAAVLGITINFSAWESEIPAAADVINSFHISVEFLVVFVLFFITGYFLYAFIYAALGSTVSRVEDAATVVTVPIILMIAAFALSIISMNNISASYVAVLSYIPFFTPYIMFSRYAMGEAGLLSVLISLVIMCATIALIGWIAARIYKLGVMMYGKPMNPIAILRQSFGK